jgi:hypothetical protein
VEVRRRQPVPSLPDTAGRTEMRETFSRVTLRVCYDRAAARCECERPGHGHAGRCSQTLSWWGYGRLAPGGWVAVPRTRGAWGEDHPENTKALCWQCYQHGLQEADQGEAA